MSYSPIQGQDCHGKHPRSVLLFLCLSASLCQLDAGIHPAYDGLAALPFYDEFDLSTVDILLISQ